MSSKFEKIPIANIVIKEGRIRRDLGDLEGLAAELKRDGLLKPVLVNAADYSLIDGERRVRAALLAGWDEIDAHIKEIET